MLLSGFPLLPFKKGRLGKRQVVRKQRATWHMRWREGAAAPCVSPRTLEKGFPDTCPPVGCPRAAMRLWSTFSRCHLSSVPSPLGTRSACAGGRTPGRMWERGTSWLSLRKCRKDAGDGGPQGERGAGSPQAPRSRLTCH